MPAWLAVQRSKAVFSLILYDSINDMKLFRNVCIALSRDTVIFVVDSCQVGQHLILGLKMELMACADLVGGTTEQSCIFTDLI